jgi:hypothetical protein
MAIGRAPVRSTAATGLTLGSSMVGDSIRASAAACQRRIWALGRMADGEVSTETELRRTAIRPSIGRRRRIMARAPDRRLIGLPLLRRGTTGMEPCRTTVVPPQTTARTLVLIRRHGPRVSRLRTHSRLRTFPAEEDIRASQAIRAPQEDTGAEVGMLAGAADAGNLGSPNRRNIVGD